MYCPICKREVVPKTKMDFDKCFTGAGLAILGILLVSAIFTMGLTLLAGFAIYYGLRSGAYKYCPICYTPLTKPEFGGDAKPLHEEKLSDDAEDARS